MQPSYQGRPLGDAFKPKPRLPPKPLPREDLPAPSRPSPVTPREVTENKLFTSFINLLS